MFDIRENQFLFKNKFYKVQLNSTSDILIFLPVGFEHNPDLSWLNDFLMSNASSDGCEPSEE